MENKYFLRVHKSQRPEVKEEYPNLAKNPVRIPLAVIETDRDISSLRDSEIEELIEKFIEKKGLKTPDKYPLERKEKLYLIQSENPLGGSDPVWSGKVKIPKQYRGENPDVKISKMVGTGKEEKVRSA